MTSIKLCTFNTKGLNDKKKRIDVFDWLKKKKIDICFLQETHSTTQVEQIWQQEWGYNAHFSSHTGNSRGVAILIQNTFAYKLVECYTDTEGRFIILRIEINEQHMTLVNVYGPNQDQPIFFENLKLNLERKNDNNLIIGGDFNVVQDFSKDTFNIKNRNNPKASEKVQEMKFDLDLCDPWRNTNPTLKQYTWHNSRNQQSRLDYFLVSNHILSNLTNEVIKPGYRSDHSLVEINILITRNNKGRGFWKFNNSLLKDNEYTNEIRTCIKNTIHKYSRVNVNVEPDNERFTINDKLLFEMLKMEIRGKTIAFSSAKRKNIEKNERLLEEKINMDYEQYLKSPSENNLNELTKSQERLKTIRETKIEGIILRSKANWQLNGERNSKYFLHLENKHYQDKLIPMLITDAGKEVNEIDDILEVQKKYYKKLYTSRKPLLDEECEKSFFPNAGKGRVLSENEALSMEQDISVEECFTFLKNMKKNKSPGSDGYTVEFYLHFWNDLKHYMVRSFRESFQQDLLTESQRLGIITCLPKPGKPRQFIKNWRPVTLLNIDYKIISGVISNRIKKHLDNLISNCQKGFIAGRQIGECTRLISDIINKLKKINKPGILLMIDFEKAFDSVEWNFLDRTLRYFNFGKVIRKWIKLFYTNIESCTINNGHCSSRFRLERGVRQGDPLSPYIFILMTEILTRSIMKHEDIKGINLDDSEFLISQLADDTTLLLEPNEKSFRTCMSILNKFALYSGLSINFSKTLAIKIGLDERFFYDLGDKNIMWQTEGTFKLLGIEYNLDENDITRGNYEKKVRDFEKCLGQWYSRKLTIYGKICIIKSLALPKLVHLFSSLPDPPEKILNKLQALCFNFVWNNKPDKIKRSTLFNTYENGGFKMPNIKIFCQAQKIIWVKKILDDQLILDWKTLLISDLERNGGNYIWLTQHTDAAILKNINPFWKDVFKAWTSLTDMEEHQDHPHSETLFYNDSIRVAKKTIFNKEWIDKGIRYINDILGDNGQLMDWNQFSIKFNIRDQAFKYISLIHAVPKNWKKRIKEMGYKLNEVKQQRILKLKCLKKPGKFLYNKKIEMTATRPEKSENKWNTNVSNNSDEEWKALYKIPFVATKEIHLRMMQMKILHRILPLNDWLFKTKLINFNTCTFCSIQVETIEHFFYDCIQIKSIWLQLAEKLHLPPFTMKQVLLGDTRTQNISVENIKLLTKEYIYKAKINDVHPNWEGLKNTIKLKMKIEQANTNHEIYIAKWGNVIHLLF